MKMVRLLPAILLAVAVAAAPAPPTTGAIPASLVGKWGVQQAPVVLIFKKDGTYQFDMPGTGETSAWGRCTFRGNTVRFEDLGGVRACKGPGTYTYQVVGKTLTFKLQSDACKGRQHALGATWTRKT